MAPTNFGRRPTGLPSVSSGQFSTEAPWLIAALTSSYLLDEPRQANERLAHPLTEHHERKQAADQIAGRSRSTPCRRRSSSCRASSAVQWGSPASPASSPCAQTQDATFRLRDAFVPNRSALGLQGKRFHRLNSDDGLGHRGTSRSRRPRPAKTDALEAVNRPG